MQNSLRLQKSKSNRFDAITPIQLRTPRDKQVESTKSKKHPASDKKQRQIRVVSLTTISLSCAVCPFSGYLLPEKKREVNRQSRKGIAQFDKYEHKFLKQERKVGHDLSPHCVFPRSRKKNKKIGKLPTYDRNRKTFLRDHYVI